MKSGLIVNPSHLSWTSASFLFFMAMWILLTKQIMLYLNRIDMNYLFLPLIILYIIYHHYSFHQTFPSTDSQNRLQIAIFLFFFLGYNNPRLCRDQPTRQELLLLPSSSSQASSWPAPALSSPLPASSSRPLDLSVCYVNSRRTNMSLAAVSLSHSELH